MAKWYCLGATNVAAEGTKLLAASPHTATSSMARWSTQQKLIIRDWNARECSQIKCCLVLQHYQSLNLKNLDIKNHTVNSIKTIKTAGKVKQVKLCLCTCNFSM